MDLVKVDNIIDNYDGEKSWLIMILQDVQEAYNYLPAEALQRVAEKLGVGLGQLYNVATFYSSFSLTERGRHVIRVCDGTACHLRGSDNLRDEITRQLGIEEGQTTPDKMFTFETVACLGACALAPVMTIDSKYYGKLTPNKVKAALDTCKA
ncbi:MAG: NADH-quinone oxidoreductase subunit NuoE [Planctomycetota bacterium]|nr:NADH-quinone oxidoreductase subunit NuoE [Planctomycetota bacterium]